jgi:GH24 family phage-related lysozyme (muramidase)
MSPTINDAGLKLIESFEDQGLTSYQDSVWTIGYGHTQGQTITQQQVDAFRQ